MALMDESRELVQVTLESVCWWRQSAALSFSPSWNDQEYHVLQRAIMECQKIIPGFVPVPIYGPQKCVLNPPEVSDE